MKSLLSLVLLIVMCEMHMPSHIRAAALDPVLEKRVQALSMNAGNVGTEFYFSFIPCYTLPTKRMMHLYLCSQDSGTVKIEIKAHSFYRTLQMLPNVCSVVELDPGIGQAAEVVEYGYGPNTNKYAQAAVHIYSNVGIVVCATNISDSFLALPVQALDTAYYVTTMPDISWSRGGSSFPSEVAVVAAYDNTLVSFTAGGATVTRTTSGIGYGQTGSVNLNKGDVWLVANDSLSKEEDLCGSYVHANKPIAVISGNMYANAPKSIGDANHLMDQQLPISSWSKTVLIPRNTSRLKSYWMRVIASEPATKLNYNCASWKTLSGTEGREGTRWIDLRVNDTANNILSLSADHPIYVTVYNTGHLDDNRNEQPFQMTVIPTSQFQKQVMFATPDVLGGISVSTRSLGLIFPLDSNGKMPSTLEFAIAKNGQLQWKSYSAFFGSSINSKDIYCEKIGGLQYAYKECSLPSGCVCAIRCNQPFAAYLFGQTDYDAYAHPLISGVPAPFVASDFSAPTLQYKQGCDGSVGMHAPASATDLPLDSSRSNLASIVLADSSTNYAFEAASLVPSKSSTVLWSLHVIDSTRNARAIVVATDAVGNSTQADIRYYPFNITCAQKSLNMGVVHRGDSLVRDVEVRNLSAKDQLITSFEWSSAGNSAFKLVQADSLPLRLPALSTRQLQVMFKAGTLGEFKDSLTVHSACDRRYLLSISATADTVAIPVDGVDDAESREFFCTPNPSNGEVTLHLPNNWPAHIPAQIEVFNSLAHRVYFESCMNGIPSQHVLNLQSLIVGVYTLRITSSAGTLSTRCSVLR